MSIEQFLFLKSEPFGLVVQNRSSSSSVASVASCSINCRFYVQRRPFTALSDVQQESSDRGMNEQ